MKILMIGKLSANALLIAGLMALSAASQEVKPKEPPKVEKPKDTKKEPVLLDAEEKMAFRALSAELTSINERLSKEQAYINMMDQQLKAPKEQEWNQRVEKACKRAELKPEQCTINFQTGEVKKKEEAK